MLSLITLVVTSVLATFVVAQAPNATFPPSVITQITGEVDLTTRNSWCTSQHSTCGMLCGGATDANGNNCDGATLNFTCLCSSNHSAPASEYYIGTIPTFICNRAKGDCFATNAGDLTGQQRCNATFICGNGNATLLGAQTTTMTSSAPASSATGSATGTTSPSASTTAKSAAIRIGQEYGVGLLIAVMGAVMGLTL